MEATPRFSQSLYDGILRTYIYVTGLCSVAATGNAISEIGTNHFHKAFGEAYLTQAKVSIPISALYPLVFNYLKKSKHYRLLANLYQASLTTRFVLWHEHAGTENPIQTVSPMAIAAFVLVNKHVSDTLENRLS